MKAILSLGIFSVLSLFLTSCGSGGYTKYTGTNGMELEYPSSWKAGKETGGYVNFLNEKTKSIIVAGKQKIVTPKTDAEIFEHYKARGALAINNLNVGGVPGKYVEYTTTLGQNEFYHKEAWKTVGGDVYSVACTLREAEKTSDIQSCNHIIETLK
ncbi:MAG: hypothetical protein HHAS10_01480 [Candidatus Altimarinota bacterium]